MLIGVCHMLEYMDTDWCLSNGGGHRILIGVCHGEGYRILIGVCQMVEDIGY